MQPIKLPIILLLALVTPTYSQLIPSSRIANWTPGTHVGVIGGIPLSRPVQTTVVADTTGVVDATSAIQNAINNAPANSVVFLPAGTYKTSNLSMKSDVTLRGAGMNATTLAMTSGGFTINSSGLYQPFTESPGGWILVTGGKTAGSTAITFADASSFDVGNHMQISPIDDPSQFANPVVMGSGWSRRQTVVISSKVGNTVNFWPPLLSDWSAIETRAADMTFAPGSYRKGVGLESFRIILNPTNQGVLPINFSDCSNSWMYEVRVSNPNNYSSAFERTVNCEIRRCWFDEQLSRGSNHSGILYENGATAGLIEDNVIRTSYPGIENNFGATGTVVAYNLFYNQDNSLGILCNHGAHNEFFLFEGNVMANVQSDGYFGSGSTQLFYRNWCTGWTPPGGALAGNVSAFVGYTFAFKRFSRDMTVVGNILNHPEHFISGDDGTSFGLPHIGNGDFVGHAPPWADWKQYILPNGYHEFDDGVAATLVRKVNYSFAIVPPGIPAGEVRGAQPFPDSLFRTSKPAYFGNLTWPPFNPESLTAAQYSGNNGYTRIPAGYRYFNGAEVPPSGGDTTPPGLSSAIPPSIDASGTTLTVTFNEPVSIGSGGAGGWTISASPGGAATLTNPSGTNVVSMNLPISRAIQIGEAVTISYTQPGNGIEDVAGPGNDLASFVGVTAINNSQQGGVTQVATPVISLPSGAYFGPQSTTIACATSGAAIYYTLDGSAPTASSSLYSSGVSLPNNATLRAIGIKVNTTDSAIAQETYEINQWTISSGTKTFVVPQRTANFTWTFTVLPEALFTTAISMGPNPISQPPDWSMCIAFFDTGVVQVKNGATFAATSVLNWSVGNPYTVVVSCNMTAHTYSVTVNGTTIATNYAFADGQPTATELDNVGLFKSGMAGGSVISNMTFTLPAGAAVGIETINVQGIKIVP